MSCSSTIKHFSHPEHPLVLKEDVVFGVDATCCVCNKPVISSPTYTCSTSDNINCQKFYLHKICAELPKEIIRDKQDPHPLTLLQRVDGHQCDVCEIGVKFSYACVYCGMDICVACACVASFIPDEQRVIRHEGHGQHTLTLQRQALFKCDACYEEAKDYSYVCFTCDFWIHQKCVFSPLIIPAPTYHHHPLTLIFSIPFMHRYFGRYCPICNKRVQVFCWSYYCHKCTFFVHMRCAMSTATMANEVEPDFIDDEPGLVQIPLPSEESIFDLIVTQCCKLQLGSEGESQNGTSISSIFHRPHIIEEHWSHMNHPLEQLQFALSENDDDDSRVLICDGCIQPFTVSHPSYYACIQCRFFLHFFCATSLPPELPVGASPFHPQHSLLLKHNYKISSFVTCAICNFPTNGFYYACETCNFKVDIRCAFLPTKIRHKSHKHSYLVKRPSSKKICSVSRLMIGNELEYACETCSSFRISILCVFVPSGMKHRYDDHPLLLRLPPFFYEGVFYCQICEEQVDNQRWLYHCDECDQSFHSNCLCSRLNVKLGRTMKHSIGNESHTLALVIKETARRNSPPYSCNFCEKSYKAHYFFECKGCGYLLCISCVRKKLKYG